MELQESVLRSFLTGKADTDISIVADYLVSFEGKEEYQQVLSASYSILESICQYIPPKEETDDYKTRTEKEKAFNYLLLTIKEFVDKKRSEHALHFIEIGEHRLKKECRRISKNMSDLNVSFYHCFSLMEYALVDEYYALASSQPSAILSLDAVSLYVLKAQSYLIDDRFEEAKDNLRKAFEYNPVSVELSFMMADLDFKYQNYISFLMDLDKVHRFCFKNTDLKRYFRYLAKYYKEYDNRQDLVDILSKIGDNKVRDKAYLLIHQLSDEERQLLDSEKISYEISSEVVTVAIKNAKDALKDDDIPKYKFFFEILHNFMNDNTVNQLLNQTEEKKK